jgi:O-antigen ligase
MQLTIPKIRWVVALSAFLMLGGLLASLAATSFLGAAAVGMILLAPVVLISLPKGIAEAIRKFKRLLNTVTWWHWVWLLVLCSGFVFRIRDLREINDNPVDSWAVFRITLEVIVALVLAVRLVGAQRSWMRFMFRGLVGVLTVYGMACLASTLWSVYPAWTLYRSLEYLADVALLAAILSTFQSLNAYKVFFDWTWTVYILLIAWTWFQIFIWRDEALQTAPGVLGLQLYGVVPNIHANMVGELGAVLAVVALSRLILRSRARFDRAWYGLLLIGSLATLVISQTRSAMAGFALGFLVVLFFSRHVLISAFLALGAGLYVWLGTGNDAVWEFLRRGESQQELATFSSRLDWWQIAWQKFLEHPFTGWGAYAGGRFVVFPALKITYGAGVHSDYMEILVGTGLWGLIPALVAVLMSWWVLIRWLQSSSLQLEESGLALEAIGVLAVVSVRSFFGNSIFWHPPLIFLTVLGYAELLRRCRAPAAEEQVCGPAEAVMIPGANTP